jgi:cell division transport system ATP-binding protein
VVDPKLVIDLRGVACRRGRSNALEHVSLEVAAGEVAFVTGPSGAGKSTLLGLIHGDLELAEGQGFVGGWALHDRRRLDLPLLRRAVGMIYQDYRLLPRLTALENIVFAIRAVELGMHRTEAISRAGAHLEGVGLADKAASYPGELSGGEQQRLAIARTLAVRPRVLLADEPTGNLDSWNAYEVVALLTRVARSGTAVVIATHDRALLRRSSGRRLRLENGMLLHPSQAVARSA